MHDGDCRSVEFDPTSNHFVSASFDGTVGIYNINKKEIEYKILNHEDRVV